jgi:hypothetical protein
MGWGHCCVPAASERPAPPPSLIRSPTPTPTGSINRWQAGLHASGFAHLSKY